MVSSQISVAVAHKSKSLLSQLFLPVVAPDAVPSDPVQCEFTDVFGPLPVQNSTEMNVVNTRDVTGLVYDDPVTICSRSHSLVGPTTCTNQSLKLSKLTLDEMEESLELEEFGDTGTPRQDVELTSDEGELNSLNYIDNQTSEQLSVGLEDFDILKLVGQGAFGKVFQVRKIDTSEIYAMKVIRKDRIKKDHAGYVRAERDILTKIEHPFIVQLKYSFQTKYRLYLVLDFVNGGHLFFQLYHQGLFREDLARIYTAEIVSAVSHLHKNGIMHRDLKPENILLDADGHVMLTDFGLAKQFDENTRSNSICGTVEYMAPEIVLGKNHDKAADWWSVGVLLFEMLTGKQPFLGGNRQKIQQRILKDKIKLPAFLTSEAHSLLKGLLQKEASRRLGSGSSGSEEIKRHKWFKSINWKKLEDREIQPSFIPNVAGIHCTANFDKRWTNMSLVDSPVSSPTARHMNFEGFSYVRPATFLRRDDASPQ